MTLASPPSASQEAHSSLLSSGTSTQWSLCGRLPPRIYHGSDAVSVGVSFEVHSKAGLTSPQPATRASVPAVDEPPASSTGISILLAQRGICESRSKQMSLTIVSVL